MQIFFTSAVQNFAAFGIIQISRDSAVGNFHFIGCRKISEGLKNFVAVLRRGKI